MVYCKEHPMGVSHQSSSNLLFIQRLQEPFNYIDRRAKSPKICRLHADEQNKHHYSHHSNNTDKRSKASFYKPNKTYTGVTLIFQIMQSQSKNHVTFVHIWKYIHLLACTKIGHRKENRQICVSYSYCLINMGQRLTVTYLC
jgi:hypothetical protein